MSEAHGITLDVGPGVATFTAGDATTNMRLTEPVLADLDPAWQDTRIARTHAGLTEMWWVTDEGLRLQVQLAEVTGSTMNLRWALDGDAAKDPAEVVALGMVALGDLAAWDGEGNRVPVAGALDCGTEGCELAIVLDTEGVMAPVTAGMRWALPALANVASLTPGVIGTQTQGSILAMGIDCYRDSDNDGFGDTSDTVPCPAVGYVDEPGDCDDGDINIFPGARETASDGVDQDCDGDDALWTLADVSPGDLVINEIMRNPAVVDDDVGEWFEIVNRSGLDLSASGMHIRDDDDDAFTLGFLEIPAGGIVVVGNNSDPLVNGGYTPDATMPPFVVPGNGFALANGADELYIARSAGSPTIDGVAWNNGVAWPNHTNAAQNGPGRAMNLDPDAIDEGENNSSFRWCAASTVFGAGDRGTPGSANTQCSGGDPTLPNSTPPANLCFEYEYVNDLTAQVVTNPPEFPVIEIDFTQITPTSGTFATNNLGTGTWTSGHNAVGVWVAFTYDVTGANYRGIKPTAGSTYSGQIRIGHPWTGTWNEVACPP